MRFLDLCIAEQKEYALELAQMQRANSALRAALDAAMSRIIRLEALAEAAEGIERREEIGGYGHEGIPDLLKALKALKERAV